MGLLNIGVEEIKGVEEVRQAHAWLKETDLAIDYRGFIEGDQIGQGVVDVVVVEGFAGNIALKTAEGTAKQMATYVREALTSSPVAKLGALLARGGLQKLRERMDPRRINGGPFLGLNGIAIKSHGGTDALGFASAIERRLRDGGERCAGAAGGRSRCPARQARGDGREADRALGRASETGGPMPLRLGPSRRRGQSFDP